MSHILRPDHTPPTPEEIEAANVASIAHTTFQMAQGALSVVLGIEAKNVEAWQQVDGGALTDRCIELAQAAIARMIAREKEIQEWARKLYRQHTPKVVV